MKLTSSIGWPAAGLLPAPNSVDQRLAPSNWNRDAIYAYLTAVYALVTWWAAEGQEIPRAHRALRLQGLDASAQEGPFAAIIRCTADPVKADKRTRSKWSRLMRYAAVYKVDSDPLDQFIKRKGGINHCAARFSRSRGEVLHREP